MIASLRGEVALKSIEGVVIDVGGVGYLVQVSSNTLHALPPVGQSARVDVHTHVREDQISLFGFAVPGERALFKHLCEVSGIGPKMALTVLSGISPRELITAVMTEDVGRLQKISGVGKRLAARMILDLKDKLAKDGLGLVDVGSLPAAPASVCASARDDLSLALSGLGYSKAEVERVVQTVLRGTQGDEPVEVLLRAALTELNPLGSKGRRG